MQKSIEMNDSEVRAVVAVNPAKFIKERVLKEQMPMHERENPNAHGIWSCLPLVYLKYLYSRRLERSPERAAFLRV